MTVAQKISFKQMLRTLEYRLTDVCHGDCVGVDEEAHAIVREHFKQRVRIHVFPPEDNELRAYCGNGKEDGEEVRIYDPTSYLRRDKDMVDASRAVIAMPFESNEKVRSGTWSSIRHARAAGRFLCIIYPDGTMKMNKPEKRMRVVKSYDTLKKARKASKTTDQETATGNVNPVPPQLARYSPSFEEERMC